MKIIYELNPPKLIDRNHFDHLKLINDLKVLEERVFTLKNYIQGVHLTDSVLGSPRFSSISAAKRIKSLVPSLEYSCSVRTCDRNIVSISQIISDSILGGIKSLLLIKGDASKIGDHDTNLNPTDVIAFAKKTKIIDLIQFDLSFPNKLKKDKFIDKKIQAQPRSFITQTISSLTDLGEIVDFAKNNGIRTTACIMIPCDKNLSSASSIGLDWSTYNKNPIDFVKEAGKMADEILITSPNSFRDGLNFLMGLK